MPKVAMAQRGSFWRTAAKGLLARREPERVQHRHRALQLRLHLGITGIGESDLAELPVLFVDVLRRSAAGERERKSGHGR